MFTHRRACTGTFATGETPVPPGNDLVEKLTDLSFRIEPWLITVNLRPDVGLTAPGTFSMSLSVRGALSGRSSHSRADVFR